MARPQASRTGQGPQFPGPASVRHPDLARAPPPSAAREVGIALGIAAIIVVSVTLPTFVVVYGLLEPRDPCVQPLILHVSRSADSSNWSVWIWSTPCGLSLNTTGMVIRDAANSVVLPSAPLSTYLVRTDGVSYHQVAAGAEDVAVGDAMLINNRVYSGGSKLEISTGTTILASVEL